MSLRAILALVLVVGFCKPISAAIIIQNYSDAANNRFTNDPQFIAAAFNLSGVGQSGAGQWGTLISSNVIVSANHFAPSGNIVFYPGNDPNSTPVVRLITGNTQRLGSSDIWLAQLDAPVDTSLIIPFSYATQTLSGNSNASNGPNDPLLLSTAGIYQDNDAYLFGLSPAGGPVTQTQAVGRNVIDAFAKEVPFAGLTDALIFGIDNRQYEASLQGGDSGAPLFVDVNGSLVLLGVNSFILKDAGNNVVAGASTYIGNYVSAVENFIAVSAIPEPSSFAGSLLVMVGALLRRGRRDAAKAAPLSA